MKIHHTANIANSLPAEPHAAAALSDLDYRMMVANSDLLRRERPELLSDSLNQGLLTLCTAKRTLVAVSS